MSNACWSESFQDIKSSIDLQSRPSRLENFERWCFLNSSLELCVSSSLRVNLPFSREDLGTCPSTMSMCSGFRALLFPHFALGSGQSSFPLCCCCCCCFLLIGTLERMELAITPEVTASHFASVAVMSPSLTAGMTTNKGTQRLSSKPHPPAS